MKPFRTFLVVAGVLTTLGMLFSQQDMSNVKIKTTHVGGNVYMLEGQGGNIGASVGDDGILMIDDEFAPLAEKIRAALKELNSGPLKYLLNTHWHGDHTGGNPVFGKEAIIIAHTNVRKRLSTENVSKFFNRTTPPAPKEAWPVITFDESLSIFFNGEEIKVMHLPHGHTDGDAVMWFTKSNVLHMGDQFFAGRFPFIDLESGGNVKGYTDNVGRILAQIPDDIKIIPGHGPLATKADLAAFHQVLQETAKLVQDQVKAGKSVDEIKKAGFPAKYDSWASGFISADRWIDIIINSK